MVGRAAGYLNSPHTAQLKQTTSSNFSNIILSQEHKDHFFNQFLKPFETLLHQVYPGWECVTLVYTCWTDAPVDLENLLCLTMNKVAAMRSGPLLHLKDERRAEERSRLNCGPQSAFTDGQSRDPLRCTNNSENSSTIKYRRYG